MERLLTQKVVNLTVNKTLFYLTSNGLCNGRRSNGLDNLCFGDGLSNTVASPFPFRGGVFGIGRLITRGGETGINKGCQ